MFEKILFASSGNQPLYGGAGVLLYCPFATGGKGYFAGVKNV
jgi:hypothetical protein